MAVTGLAIIDRSFPAEWTVEVLATRPMILPRRHFVYPVEVEEVERGALELMVQRVEGEPFLATCALGFASPAVPTGVWSCPDPAVVCAVAGGYGYMIDSRAPERWQQLEYRPVTEVRPLPAAGLLIFVSFHAIEAWGTGGGYGRRRGSPGRACGWVRRRRRSCEAGAGTCEPIRRWSLWWTWRRGGIRAGRSSDGSFVTRLAGRS